jgi:heme/copper-type cytochrome/quinol oxidase subunit 2
MHYITIVTDATNISRAPKFCASQGYEAHLAHVAADVPLTNAEFARQEELEAGIIIIAVVVIIIIIIVIFMINVGVVVVILLVLS